MGKILHLIPDEKVTDNIIENYSLDDGNTVFFILEYENRKKYTQIVQKNVIRGDQTLFDEKNIDSEVKSIIIHGLNDVFAKLILKIDKNIAVAWIAWGFDIYYLPKIMSKLYAPKSKLYLKKTDSKQVYINFIKRKKLFRAIYYNKIKRTEDHYTIYEKAHKRIDYFCSILEEDFILFSSFYPNRLIFNEIGYFSINQYLAGQNDLRISENAKNILVGNSNSIENNHLDVIELLSKQFLSGNVIVPLSYGEGEIYKKTVIKNGNLFLKEKFEPLLDFMDRATYLNVLSSCSTAIFYHYRQQAMGNILALLYMGVRIYFSEKNPVYHYLKRIGIVVFNLDTDFDKFSNSILEIHSQNTNRLILDSLFDEDIIKRQYVNLIEKLDNVHQSRN